MLANVPKPGRCFHGLRRYLMTSRPGTVAVSSRVLWHATRNLASADPAVATKVMTATAALSARCQHPVYHLILNWRPDEAPSEDAITAMADATLARIGLAEHQALLVRHGDTEHPHVHVVVNRIHPERGVAWSAAHDYRRIERVMHALALEHGFKAVPGRHNGPTFSDTATRQDFRLTGKALHRVRRQLSPLAMAASPSEVQAVLSEHGLTLARDGRHLRVVETASGRSVTFSSLRLGVTQRELEKRFQGLLAGFESRSATQVKPVSHKKLRQPHVSPVDTPTCPQPHTTEPEPCL